VLWRNRIFCVFYDVVFAFINIFFIFVVSILALYGEDLYTKAKMDYTKNSNAQIQGNQNIVIQDVKDSQISIQIHGKEKKLEVAMNQWLVENVISQIIPYNETAQKFIKAVADEPDWYKLPKYRNAALTVMQTAYIGVIGIYLKKIAAVGIGAFSNQKLKEYIKNAYFLGLRLLDLVNAVLISALWDWSQKQKPLFSDANRKTIAQFFEQTVERDIPFSLELLNALLQTYTLNDIEFSISELRQLDSQTEEQTNLHAAFMQLMQLFENSARQEPSAEEVFWTEKALSDILIAFNFLAKYKIQAVKEVDFYHIRSLGEFFIHKLGFYGLPEKRNEAANQNAEKIMHSTKKINTEAVLVYASDYFEGINLFPFVVDINNIMLETGTNLCFFSHKELTDSNSLNYVSVADNDIAFMQQHKTGIETNFSEIFADRKSIIQHKHNLVIQLINQAQKEILGESDESGDDFLETLF